MNFVRETFKTKAKWGEMDCGSFLILIACLDGFVEFWT